MVRRPPGAGPEMAPGTGTQVRSGDSLADDAEAYVERVLAVVELVPPGMVLSYGDIALYLGTGGPRQVGQVMARYGAAVPWWRVVRSDGRPARGHDEEALHRLAAEKAPIRNGRVVMSEARFGLPSTFLASEMPPRFT